MRDLIFSALFIGFLNTNAFAFEDDSTFGYLNSHEVILDAAKGNSSAAFVSDGERFRKFNLLLDALKLPREPEPSPLSLPIDSTTTKEAVQQISPYIDPDQGLARYQSFTDSQFSLFLDFFTGMIPKTLLEHSVSWLNSPKSRDSESLMNALQAISNQAKILNNPKPLLGLKVAIDPGHMGGDFWDKETGKAVTINGKKVSEGDLNLWTAFLVSNQLEALGAEVILTREDQSPVSQEKIDSYQSEPWVAQYVYNSRDDSSAKQNWIAPFFTLEDSEFIKSVLATSQAKNLRSKTRTRNLYVTAADLEARSQIVDATNPHLVIDIHFDSNSHSQLQTATREIKSYVPGAMREFETGARNHRAFLTKHLLEPNRWMSSVQIASSIMNSMSNTTGLPLRKANDGKSILKVADGVYARNLYITRRALSSLVVYLECANYDHEKEFALLSKEDASGIYQGTPFVYPSRLNAFATGITQGILNYFQK